MFTAQNASIVKYKIRRLEFMASKHVQMMISSLSLLKSPPTAQTSIAAAVSPTNTQALAQTVSPTTTQSFQSYITPPP
ncbi:2465_t:CDS:2 [Entrophospora sp. SA101]|nr:7674_t:CDS:2 [Entrophospora sp. SA101]CAJ0650052.1 2591_t:CDS:2 [Entrophospora sp. SA101]CAJ0758576.1 2465_t:CDS:2 [Entrophospora sp. SA101]CAJ0834681.1 2352_t:CDS:2 [Entrophospora sp. SA101]CAJ0842600.1 13245_t:CDS:2 [Entrophospora sp. SA101]